MNISSSLKILRKKYNLTQKSLAEALGLSRQMIYLMENNKAKASKKTINLLIKKFPTDFEKQEKKYTKKEISEFEREILETYEIMRNENNIFSKIAAINRVLIDLNKELEGKMLILDTLITDDINIKNKIKNPIKTTLKNLKKYQTHLEEILDDSFILKIEEGEDGNGFI
ncbi:helix-turn-helix transcriptional regulator [Fusobacterium polymorphum]|uniref:helix-turn-helix transcriptional regulator n=1 Tax=Fusobacterium nucleatum subsp. polymorphum TaxID=76857 RepID=UPI00300933D8